MNVLQYDMLGNKPSVRKNTKHRVAF